MHRRVDGRHVEVTVDGDGGDNRPFHIQIEQVQSGVRGPRKSRQLLVLARPRAGGAWGAWGQGGAAGRWNFSHGSLQGHPLRRSRGAGLQNLPPRAFTVVARCFTAMEKHSRLALSVREDGPFPPPPHPEPRAD